MDKNFFDMLERRRSIRSFTDTKVSKEDIEMLISASLTAPSSKNSQSSGFVVVEDGELIEKFADMRDYGSSFVKGAPLVVLVMGDERVSDMWETNAAISATYLQLSAEALGLGSCWVQVSGRPRRKDDPQGVTVEEYLKGLVSVPEGMRILCAVAIGHPAAEDKVSVRKIRSESERVIYVPAEK